MYNKVDKLAYHFPYIANICSSWREILHFATPIKIKKDSEFMSSPDKNLNFYLVEYGLFQTKYHSASGNIRSMTCLGENTLLCLAAATMQLTNMGNRLYALKDSKVWKFDGALLNDRNFQLNYPVQYSEAMKQLSVNLLIYTTYSTGMLLDPPRQKVILFLLALKYEKERDSSLPKFTQQQMAEMLSLHRVTFVKILHELKQEGLIDFHQRREIVILDEEKLRELAFLIS